MAHFKFSRHNLL